ncbi:MAG TPA: type 1 glutamine amidotransferase [Solirubrobacteraceae bacterium]|nr:type 1 glutamine amidotransferase [Solirubrobacteraceae bacterium]
MKPTLIITHLADRGVGLVRDCLHAAGCAVVERNPGDPGALPAIDEISGLVSLGGRQSATRVDADPFLAAEVDLMAQALDRAVPVLGMCLGAQLLAVAAGGRVRPAGRMNAGWPDLELLPAAAADPVFGPFPARLPVLKWHEDIIDLPPGALPLGVTPGPGAALFRVGASAWGSQAHVELTPAMLDAWLVDPEDVADITGAGHDIEQFRAASRRHLETQMAAARPMFRAFGALTCALTSA